jgi:glutamate carboxypeptidase
LYADTRYEALAIDKHNRSNRRLMPSAVQEAKRSAAMDMLSRDLLAYAQKAEKTLIRRTRDLVEMESPSCEKAAVDRVADLVSEWCCKAGGSVIRHKYKRFGDSLEVRFGRSSARSKPIMLLGHLDTVWDLGTLKAMPWREEGDRIAGPGVLDMKAGVMMALTAVGILRQQHLTSCPIIMLLHGDEEIGSPASRRLTEKIAARCSAVYVLEPGQGARGDYKTARKGVGCYRLQVRGVGAHAGVDFDAGHSAVLELGRQLSALEALSNPARGLTVNPGLIGGGTVANIVATEAWAEIDVRFTSMPDAMRIERRLRALKAKDKSCAVTVTGGMNRPPMVRTREIAALFGRASRFATAMGLEPLAEAATGGGSDGNFTAALGIPTLDGMGAVGAGAHASHEHLRRSYLAPRTALLAAMLLDTNLV